MKILPSNKELANKLDSKIARYKDFPKDGIIFADIFTMLKDFDCFTSIIDDILDRYEEREYDYILGCESRGFIFAAAAAAALSVPFVPIRKAGKLPGEVYSVEYALEYGTDSLEISKQALKPEAKILLMDDLLATGGTAKAAIELAKMAGASVVDCYFLMDINLGGKEQIDGLCDEVYTVIETNA